MERGIGIYHPIVSISYFAIVIISSMLFMHPVFIFISLISAVIYSFMLDKDKTIKMLKYSIIMVLMIAITNTIFVNRGVSVLFYFRENPVTLESLLYGFTSGFMMLSVIIWFNCYNEIITSDKFLYVFGKILPSISLVVSMTLRLIPKLISQIQVIANAQKSVGLDYSEGKLMMRVKSSMRILSILVTWSLEDAIQTADSMKSRGYGMKKRSSFSIYTFTNRDLVMIIIIGIMAMLLGFSYVYGYTRLEFYPMIGQVKFDVLSMFIYISFFVMSILPVCIELVEAARWKSLEYKI